MNSKIYKLEAATVECERLLVQHKATLDEATQRLEAAKNLLRQMDEQDQERIQINDTKLPELIAVHQLAKDQYEETLKRFETNSKYLKIMKQQVGVE